MNTGTVSSYHFYPLGDSGLLIDFGNLIDAAVNERVLMIFHILQTACLPWITDLVPAYSSLAVFYNSQLLARPFEGDKTIYEEAVIQLQAYLSGSTTEGAAKPTRQLTIPVCYEGDFAPDLKNVAQRSGLSTGEVIRLHTSVTYRVYMIGFLPGFAYMGAVLDAIAIDRRSEPRQSVPAGSVGIAGKQTGIYPFDSPGGWQLIGKTPIALFDKNKPAPAFFQPGDEVRFQSITSYEFTNYQSRLV